MDYDAENVFAKILRGELPAQLVDEDEWSISIMDAMPQSLGHVLVIPKEPAIDIFAISGPALQQIILQTQRIARAVDKAFNPEGVMIMQLNRAGAGQSVFHLHFHVIPKWKEFDLKFHARKFEDSQVLQQHAEHIKEVLESSTYPASAITSS